MYDLSRLGGVARAGAVVLIALTSFSGLSIATLSGRPSWLPATDSTMEAGQEKVVGQRIAGAASRVRPDAAPSDLGVLLGGSAVGMGIDPVALEAAGDARFPKRWLSLYANGAEASNLRDLSTLLYSSELRFGTLVLGLHPGLIAQSRTFLDDSRTVDSRRFRRELMARHLTAAKDELQDLASIPLNWAFPNRRRVSSTLRDQLIPWKWRAFARFGMNVNHLYGADRDPWQVKLLVPDLEEPARQAAAEGRVAVPAAADNAVPPTVAKGWTDPMAYDVDNDHARALVDLVREARSRQIEVVIVILPEARMNRDATPPVAMRTVRVVLDRAFAATAPPVVDLWDALRDDQFHDTIHPNKSGRATTTRRLIEALRTYLPARP